MPMRFELVLILWVMALGAVGWAISGGSQNADSVLSSSRDGAANEAAFVQGQASATQTSITPRDLGGTPVEPRLIFAVQALPPNEQPVTDTAQDFSLRGIVRSTSGYRAVFAGPGDQPDYTVVGAGDAIGLFDVVAISADRVVLRSAGGERALTLRGRGEAQ
jgi:hypothetical protein